MTKVTQEDFSRCQNGSLMPNYSDRRSRNIGDHSQKGIVGKANNLQLWCRYLGAERRQELFGHICGYH